VLGLLKGLLIVGAILTVGAGVSARWVAPALARAERRRLRRGLIAGSVLLALVSVVDVAAALARAVGAFDVTLLPAYLINTRHGVAVLVRVVILIGLMRVGLPGSTRPAVDRARFILLGAGLLATVTLTSHAAAAPGATPALLDLAHFGAAAAWAGALWYLGWLWPVRAAAGGEVAAAARRLSSIGLGSVLVLFATGAYASQLHLWGPPALAGTAYGRALLAKLCGVGIVLVVAAVNRWRLVPAAARPAGSARLGRTVRLEAVLLAGVFALTGLLTAQAPPEPPATLANVVTFRERAGPWTVRGSLSPRAAAGFDLEFSLLDARGAPPNAPVDAQIVLTMLDHPMSPVVMRPAAVGRGSARAQVLLPMAGRWQMAVRLPDGAFTVDLAAKGTQAAAPNSAWPRFFAIALGAGAAAALVLRVVILPDLSPAPRWSLAALGIAGMALGVVLSVRAVAGPVPGTTGIDRPNPIAATPASIAAGEGVYRAHCQTCHGIAGAGDGPAAFTLRPRPADLRVHMAAGHTDGQLFFWITEGFAGTAMPAYKNALSEEERWHVVNFIRTFALTDR
jgi:putative copper export protein/mono/diheme cytochrome c family protein